MGSSKRSTQRRIVAVIPTMSYGGAERALSLLTLEWTKTFDVLTVVFEAGERAYEHGGRMLDLRLGRPNNPLEKLMIVAKAALRLSRLFVEEQPSMIISFMEPASFPATIAAITTGSTRKLVVSVRQNPDALPLMRRLAIPVIYRFPYRVVAVSDGVRRTLKRMGVPAAKLLMIPNPVLARESIGTSFGRPVPYRYILAAGRLRWQKGFDRLMDAFSKIPRPDIHLVIIGEGEEKVPLMTLAKELRIQARVHVIGFVSDIPRWYKNADCFVLASRHEGWPNVVMESMENGCPVVAFACNFGPAEMIEDSKSGILVKDGDLDVLASSIINVLEDDDLRGRLARGGSKRAAMYTASCIAPKWILC